MRPVRSQTDYNIPCLDICARNDVGFLHYADSKTGKVILPCRIHTGHFGSFATNQRAACLLATKRDSLNDFGGRIYIQLSTSKIIEEEQRLRTLHQDVI